MNIVSKMAGKIFSTTAGFRESVRTDGFSKASKNKAISIYNHRIMRLLGISRAGKTYLRYARDSKYPVHCRYDSSDVDVFRSVFEECEYAGLTDVPDVRLLIDCGANVGYSSAYFLTHFPNAKVIVVEPDSNNFVTLQKNLKPYGDRVKYYQTGVWSHSTGLTVCRGEYRDGREWATQVRESLPGETPDVQAVDIGTLLKESGFDKIDLLKIDIERSETEVFARNYADWLGKTRNLVIELHDEECERVFHQAIDGYGYSLSISHEVVICKSNSHHRDTESSEAHEAP